MSNFSNMAISREWATRPADQRFTSLTALQAATQFTRDHSVERVISSKSLTADVEDGQLVVKGPSGQGARPSHWAFGQLAGLAGAPAGYLRDLPDALAADCLNYGLQVNRDVQDVKVLLYKNGGPAEIHAANGPNYGRIWNSNIAQAAVEAFGDGLTGRFKIPGEFGKRVPITEANTTLYASDRDMVICLADESRITEVPNRRDGKTGALSTGIALGNSDVGAGRYWMAYFAFDYMCCNRIIWGMRDVEELSFKHTSSAPHRFFREVVPAMREMARSTATLSESLIVAAQNERIDNLEKFLTSRKFTRSQVSGIKAAYKSDEGVSLPTDSEGVTSASIWDAVVAATAYARSLQYQDERVTIEREAGRILQLAA